MDGAQAGPSKGAFLLLPGDAAALSAASLAAGVPDTDRRAVLGPGRLFGLQSPAENLTPEGALVAECSFSDAVLVKAANRVLITAFRATESAFTWTSPQLNHNTVAAPHYDSGTIGPSAIALLGDFTG